MLNCVACPATVRIPVAGNLSSSMKSPKAAPIPLENWIGYRFSLISARLGEFVAGMYANRHDLTVPAWRSLAVIARYQPLTAKQLAARTSSDAEAATITGSKLEEFGRACVHDPAVRLFAELRPIVVAHVPLAIP